MISSGREQRLLRPTDMRCRKPLRLSAQLERSVRNQADFESGGAELGSAFEKHYRISELAALWGLGRETVRLLVKDDPGVVKVRFGRKKSHTTYSVPESIAVKIHTRLLNGR